MKTKILLKSTFILLLIFAEGNELYAQYTLSFRAESGTHYNCIKDKLGNKDVDSFFDLWEHSLQDALLNRINDLKEPKDIVIFKNREKKEHWYILGKNTLPPTNHILVKVICTSDTHISFFYSEINKDGIIDKQRSKSASEHIERLIKTTDVNDFMRNFAEKIYPKDLYKDYETTVKSTFHYIDNNKLSNEVKIQEYQEMFEEPSPFKKRFREENHDLYYRHAVDYYTLSVQRDINVYNEETDIVHKASLCPTIIDWYEILIDHCNEWGINKCKSNFTEELKKWENRKNELNSQLKNSK